MSGSSSTKETASVAERKLINEEYKIWKKNTYFLYDIVMSHALEYPSHTVQWLPNKICAEGKPYSIQHLLLGTYTPNNDQNYLMIFEVHLPSDNSAHDELSSGSRKKVGSDPRDKKYQNVHKSTSGNIEIIQEIKHEGVVKRSRYMPQNTNIIATKSTNNEVFIFDRSKQPKKTYKNSTCQPDLRLLGHTKYGHGLSWNPRIQGHLLSGSNDKMICLWDLSSASKTKHILQPKAKFYAHKDAVNDVAWNCHNENIFASCGDDKMILIWDIRTHDYSNPANIIADAHNGAVICLDFNPFSHNLLLTGSVDKTAALWDLRHLKRKLHSFKSHTDRLCNVSWAPFNETIMASCGADRRINVWDLSRIGQEQEPDDADDGPPELLFIHGGHTNKIPDISWNPNDDWILASVSDDNILQIWQMAENIYIDDN